MDTDLCQSTEAWFLVQNSRKLQLQFIDGRRFSCRDADADSHGLTIQKTTETQLLLLNTVIRASSIAPCIWQSCVRCSVFAFGVQDYGIFWEIPGLFRIQLGSTVDTCLASVHEAFWKIFTRFGPSYLAQCLVPHGFMLMRQTMEALVWKRH